MRQHRHLLMSGIAAVACTVLSGSPGRSDAQTTSTKQTGWGRGGVCYEVFVRSFFDSDGDGVGDLRGLTQKLDYINDGNPASHRDLGANCVWLMPVAQSPSYHGYDVTDYYSIDREYGTNLDFKRFVREAHKRGIRVLVDLVLNHTSSEHPWFQSALRDSASPYRDWYLWSPVQKTVKGWGAPVWHRSPVRNEYYYGLFWSGMPDLNLTNPAVKAETRKIAQFWLTGMGVDGFRLDAVGHFIEAPDTVRNASANHPWLRDYEADIKRIAPNAFTVGEVTYENPDEILKYYPDQLDSYFTFQVADLLIDAVRTGSAARLMPALVRSQQSFPAGRWSPFLRNHDQTRTMTELDGDFNRARLAASLLLTLPGFPFMYYGEEIGMKGSKPDPRLRTPMQWKPVRGGGFTTGSEWESLQPDSLTTTVQAQEKDAASLLNLYRTLIHLRAANPAIGSGDFIQLSTGSDAVAAYLRRGGGRNVVVVANLGSGKARAVALSSPTATLVSGTYVATSLLGHDRPSRLQVNGTGSISRWIPAQTLEPFTVRIIELSRRK